MTARRVLVAGAVVTSTAALAWVLFIGLPRWATEPGPGAATPATTTPAEPARRIRARLFYVSESGTKLTRVEQEIPYGEGTLEQAKAILTAQMAPVAAPLVSAVPPGSTLRAVFIAAGGEAYVDMSNEFASAHPGGSTNELLTIHTIVQALTANLPGITGVQLLINGKEVDTLAGHVDLRRPFTSDPSWIE